MISDGCGYNHIDATDMYVAGETGVQPYEKFALRYAMSTYSADGHGYDPAQAWAVFDYVNHGYTDSAAAGTALSTGHKTHNGAIGVDVDGNVLRNILEKAEERGKATGVVTTVPFSHATPAAFVAHNAARYNYAAIAQQMLLDSAVDVIMGADYPWFDNDGNRVDSPIGFAHGEAAGFLHSYADEFDPVRGAYIDNTDIGAFLLRIMDARLFRLYLPILERRASPPIAAKNLKQ